jgi:hypothetical protein
LPLTAPNLVVNSFSKQELSNLTITGSVDKESTISLVISGVTYNG